MYAWCAGVALALLLGLVVGIGQGAKQERQLIANECRAAGSFSLRRTGFECRKMGK